MNYRRHSLSLKLISYLILGLMSINPALALQYQDLNRNADFSGRIPDYQPRAYHIHISQKDAVLALLRKQGYDVIPASENDARRFLNSNAFVQNRPVQLAANFNLGQVYKDECSYSKIYCYREECDNYPKERRKDCPDDTPPVQSADSRIDHPPEDNCNKTAQGRDCPPECLDGDRSNDRGCPEECLSNPCTATDPVERARDSGPVSNKGESRPAPRATGSVSIHQGFQLPNIGGGGGGKGDAAAVMLIIIGVVVIAALFIYAGKWLVDMLSNDEDYYAYWWDIGTQFMVLDTEANQHGNFTGLKFSGGFIANRLAHFGLAVEVGRMDLDLLYNRNSIPQRVNLEGTYWLLGPTVRWLLGNVDTEQAINNSYFHLQLLGGGSDRNEVDKMALARVGFNTGIGRHLRLGLHYGAFYLGLDQDQGFANDGDNYWNMYGMEIGYQF